jgi:negative regulator of flagellin synthesis FlgM
MNIRKISSYVTGAIENSKPVGQSGAEDKAAAGNGVSTDRVQLSQNYQDLAQAQKAISGAGEIRADKVQEIKSKLDTGSYQIKPDAIAQKMIDEVI